MSYDFKISGGDWKIGSDGDIEKIEGTEKLIQDILKIVQTPLGSNKYFPWYGSLISKSLIGTAFDMEFTSTMATSHIVNALEILQQLQQEQAKQQRVTPTEQLAALRRVSIDRNRVDLRFFDIAINVVTRALTTAQADFVVRPTL